MRILFLSRWFPYPPNNGAKLRVYHLLKGLEQQHEVHLLSFSDRPPADATNAAETGCASVRVVQWREFDPNSWRALAGLFSLTPRSLVDTYSVEMEREIRRILSEQDFDLVIISQWLMNSYRRCFVDQPVLLEEMEVGVPYGEYLQASNPFSRLRHGLTWLKLQHFIRKLLEGDQICTVVSEQERALLAQVVPKNHNVHVIPNGVDMQSYGPIHEEPEPNHLIFSGSFRYNANYDAMLWFLGKVYPLIQAEIPDVRLTITGDGAGLHLPKRAGVTQTGFVPDVRPYIARAWASIVPLRVGGGTRLKILEAMALHTPVVSTTKGAEGLAVENNRHLLTADSAEEFARQTVRLLKNPALRDQLTANACQMVRETYDWRVVMPEFLRIVDRAASANITRPKNRA